jgi:hypothetical protein
VCAIVSLYISVMTGTSSALAFLISTLTVSEGYRQKRRPVYFADKHG